MSPRERRAALVLIPVATLSVIGASALVGVLGGDWLAVLALGLLLCVTGGAAWLALYSWNAQKRPVRRPRPRPRWRKREGRRDGYVSDGDTAEGLDRLIVDGRINVHGDRDRWAS